MDHLTKLVKTTDYPTEPDARLLETFDKPKGMQGEVTFICTEFTSICPVTGQPDFGSWRIDYKPNALCLESKSLKLYMGAFRSTRGFWEQLAVRVADDLYRVLTPLSLTVEASMAMRGGIEMVVREVREW